MNIPSKNETRRAQMLLFLVVVIWASNYPIAKFAIAKINVFVFNGIRFIVASALLAAIMFRKTGWTRVGKIDWPRILRAGVIANVLYQCAFIVGLSMTTAGNSAVLMATSPLWTIFLNARLYKEKIEPAMWIGMAISLAGVLLIIVGSGKKLELGGYDVIGDLICVAAAVLWALNTNLQKPLLARYSPLHLSFLMITVGTVGLTLVAIPPALTMDWSSLSWTHWVATILSGALSIALANLFWSHGVHLLGPGRTGSFSNLVPIVALVLSYFTLSEDIRLIQFIGSGITLSGVWLARR